MSEENITSGNANWTPPQSSNQLNGQQDVPNSMGAFVLGIVAICLSPICCCYGNFIAIILSIIGLVLASIGIKDYKANPEKFNEKSFKRAKTGRLLSIIALVVGILITVLFVIMIAVGSSPTDYDELMREFK